MEIETPIKEGFLLFPPQGILVKKKSWHKKYCKLFKSSRHGIDRIEIFENEEDTWKNKSTSIITLENCVKISPTPQKHQNHVFTVVTKTNIQDFATLCEQEMQEWISAFQVVAFKDEPSVPSIMSDEVEEDNDLYCSSTEGVFNVRVVPTPTSIRCGLTDGNYTLVVNQNALQLRAPYPNERVLFTWPFMYIRRYGYKSGQFTFEAGRKCDSGEGTFQLENHQQQEIFKCISLGMKSWRKSVYKDEPTPTSPTLISSGLHSPPMIACGDGQFQAALSMEPGSRTPLPPSPTSATNRFVITELTNMFENATNVSMKQKPTKPPRKMQKGLSAEVIDPQLYSKLSHDQGIDTTYDDVEVRKEAWKTLGVTDLTHTENVIAINKSQQKAASSNSLDETVQKSRKIINQTTIDATENYDTLQHFGGSQPVSIKSNSSKSLYKQITPQPITPTAPLPSYDFSFNEYDTVQEHFQQDEVRPADDSHLGYGMIRKNTVAIPPAETNIASDLEYAVVVKPKKV